MDYTKTTQNQLCSEFNRITDICIAEYSQQDNETRALYSLDEYLNADKQRNRVAHQLAINYIDEVNSL